MESGIYKMEIKSQVCENQLPGLLLLLLSAPELEITQLDVLWSAVAQLEMHCPRRPCNFFLNIKKKP